MKLSSNIVFSSIIPWILIWTLVHPASAIVVSDLLHDPVVIPGEPKYGLNLDGVALLGIPIPRAQGLDDIISVCSGSLISRRHVLTAAHCWDTDRDGKLDKDITLGFPLAAVFELSDRIDILEIDQNTIQVSHDWLDNNGDIAVFTLKQDAPADIPRYTLYGGRDELGQTSVLAGYGAFGSGIFGAEPLGVFGGQKRAGRNRLEALEGEFHLAYDFDSGRPENNALAARGSESDLGLGDDEAISGSGDSGGPMFIQGALAGIHSWGGRLEATDVNSQTDGSWGELAFSTRVSSFRRFLLDATGGQATFNDMPHPCGDLDLDYDVDSADLLGFLEHWTGSMETPAGTATFTMGDCDVDRDVDSADLLTFLEHWSGSAASPLASVPEPAGSAHLIFWVLAGILRKVPRSPLTVGGRTSQK